MDKSLLIILVITVIAMIFYAGYNYGKKRSRDLYDFARQRGLKFTENPVLDVEQKFEDFDLFFEGNGKQARNLIEGETGGAYIMLFDYLFKTWAGQLQQDNTQAVLVIRSDKLNLPAFKMYPENFFAGISAALGKQDINFESNVEFSKSYILRGEDENGIRKTFNDQMLSFFARHKGLFAEGRGNSLLLYRKGNPMKLEEVKVFFNEGMEGFRLFHLN